MKIKDIICEGKKKNKQNKSSNSEPKRASPETVISNSPRYTVVRDNGFNRDFKKWAKKRSSFKGKEHPDYIINKLVAELEIAPKDPAGQFDFHKINKSRTAQGQNQIYGAKVTRTGKGDRAIYTVDDNDKVVTLQKLRPHDSIYEEDEYIEDE